GCVGAARPRGRTCVCACALKTKTLQTKEIRVEPSRIVGRFVPPFGPDKSVCPSASRLTTGYARESREGDDVGRSVGKEMHPASCGRKGDGPPVVCVTKWWLAGDKAKTA
ncbi:hypothetical protein ACRALDRAFT_2035740, partial [Sodiomyces alcalophilus JCM 7366]|uniref:uncharacterized protein n=1 Tax=Sodiomyces alcalophilus JCM 7366 TaxID=591952 RepID=UPI0039B49CFF